MGRGLRWKERMKGKEGMEIGMENRERMVWGIGRAKEKKSGRKRKKLDET